MKSYQALSLAAAVATMPPSIQAEEYKACPAKLSTQGRDTVAETCGELEVPSSISKIDSLEKLMTANSEVNRVQFQVDEYGRCVTTFINNQRRPGADASSTAPDEAACAHSWAQEQATEFRRLVGQACIAYSDNGGKRLTAAQCYGQDPITVQLTSGTQQ